MKKNVTEKTNDAGLSRRNFLTTSGTLAAAACAPAVAWGAVAADDKPAILGGTKLGAIKSTEWPQIQGTETKFLSEVANSGLWCRTSPKAKFDRTFEARYAKLCGAKHCVVTNSGTSALNTSLAALGVGPGDQVITTPYTFIATINSILLHYALPVIVDIDPDSFQVDPVKMEKAITPDTKVLLPVHIGGYPADLGRIMKIAKAHKLQVVEDACQAHLGRWDGKPLGSIGTTGCFSFQVSKNLCCGDGGAVITSDDALANTLYACHGNSRGNVASYNFTYMPVRASNYRMNEFAGAILCSQIEQVEKNTAIRNANGLYLNSLLKDIPGIYPAKIYEGGQSAWHLYMFRIDPKELGLSRDKFLAALSAEGIPGWGGYSAQDWVAYIRKVYSTKAARRVYSEKMLDDWAQSTILPNFKQRCSEIVWIGQASMLAPKSDMDKIATAIRRIQKYAKAIAAK